MVASLPRITAAANLPGANLRKRIRSYSGGPNRKLRALAWRRRHGCLSGLCRLPESVFSVVRETAPPLATPEGAPAGTGSARRPFEFAPGDPHRLHAAGVQPG